MRKSELFLPVRIYDNVFNQNRFNINCPDDECATQLLYGTDELPMFQFTRKASLRAPSFLFLKNICDDYPNNHYFAKQVPKLADLFLEPNASEFYTNYPPTAAVNDGSQLTTVVFTDISCGKLANNSNLGSNYSFADSHDAEPSFSFNIENNSTKFLFKIVVEKLVASGTFHINILNGSTIILTINGPGTYEVEFLANSSTISISFIDFVFGSDSFEISYVQAELLYYESLGDNTLILDESKLKVFPTGANDIIVYCGDDRVYNAKPGRYYYVIGFGDYTNQEVYFSEVFTIKSILDLQQFYKVQWYNSCDINGAVFYSNDTLGCIYYNFLYLDAGLFEPEYDTQEEDIDNGYGDKIPSKKRWQKSIKMDVLKSPGFLTDALTGIFVHDNVYLQEPLNTNQDKQNTFYKILNVTSEVSDILDNCFQYVKLKLLLEDRFTGEGCCQPSNIISCPPTANYSGTNTCGIYQVIISTPAAVGDGLKNCSTGELVPLTEKDLVLNTSDGFYYYFILTGGIYNSVKMPKIFNVQDDGTTVTVSGKVLPYTFVTMYSKTDAGAYTIRDTVQSDETGFFFAHCLLATVTGSNVLFKVRMKSYDCPNIKESDVYDYI